MVKDSEDIARYQDLKPEEMKFIIKFLVCLVLRNFQSEQVLLPEVMGMQKKSMVASLIEENPFLA